MSTNQPLLFVLPSQLSINGLLAKVLALLTMVVQSPGELVLTSPDTRYGPLAARCRQMFNSSCVTCKPSLV